MFIGLPPPEFDYRASHLTNTPVPPDKSVSKMFVWIYIHIGVMKHYHKNELITSHLKSTNIEKTMTYDVRNLGPGFGQVQKCDGVKPVDRIPFRLVSNDIHCS